MLAILLGIIGRVIIGAPLMIQPGVLFAQKRLLRIAIILAFPKAALRPNLSGQPISSRESCVPTIALHMANAQLPQLSATS
jgi:hypothetical protein